MGSKMIFPFHWLVASYIAWFPIASGRSSSTVTTTVPICIQYCKTNREVQDVVEFSRGVCFTEVPDSSHNLSNKMMEYAGGETNRF